MRAKQHTHDTLHREGILGLQKVDSGDRRLRCRPLAQFLLFGSAMNRHCKEARIEVDFKQPRCCHVIKASLRFAALKAVVGQNIGDVLHVDLLYQW